jgi:predicted MPP superfamily phosphohydrolase
MIPAHINLLTLWGIGFFYFFSKIILFIFLINRIGIRQKKTIYEIFWATLFLSLFILPDFFLLPRPLGTVVAYSRFSMLGRIWILLILLSGLMLSFYYFFEKWKYPSIQVPKIKSTSKTLWEPAPFSFLNRAGIHNQIYDLQVNSYRLSLVGWPSEFNGLTIAHLSDLHFGKYIHPKYAQKIIQRLMQFKADLIALTGDFVSRQEDIDAVLNILKPLAASIGVFVVFGNHDHWAGVDTLKRGFRQMPFEILQNRFVLVHRKKKTLAVLGVDDLWAGEKNTSAILNIKSDAKILLAHQPDHFFLAKKLKVQLQLSGHCHGGQVCFPRIGPLIVPSNHGRRFAGGFLRSGSSTLFINRGIGGFPPIRLQCQPEVVSIRLESAPHERDHY